MKRPMTYSYYGLTQNPFDQENAYTFESIDYKEMTARLQRVVEQKGIGLYTGGSGVGKSRILHQFLKSLHPNLYKICEIKETKLTSAEFYRELAVELDLEPRQKKTTNFRAIQQRMLQLAQQQITPVLVIDEAQYLEMAIFQELILLLNFERDTIRHCVVILLGIPTLMDKLRYASLEPLRQRVLSFYHCQGLQAQEGRAYLEEKLKSAEGSLQLFEANAIELLISSAQGSLRRLDTLVTKSLEIGIQQQEMMITSTLVEAAVNEILF